MDSLSASSLILNQLGITAWSPWEPSPTFLQQRLSLRPPQNPSYLQQRSSNSISNAKTTSQPTHHHSMMKARSENANCSPLAKNPLKQKLKIHNSVKSLIEQPLAEKILDVDYKYLSNSLSCLDVAKL